MTPMGWKYEDKAFTIYANMNKNMCDNAHRESAQTHTYPDRQEQTPTTT